MATDIKNDATLGDSLVSHFEFEEASGTRVDSHGSNDLIDTNTVTQETGIQGNCADFEVSNSEYLVDTSPSGLPVDGDMAISVWVKMESQADTMIPVDGRSGSGGIDRPWALVITSAGAIQFSQRNSTNTGWASCTTSANWITSTGTWYHILVSRDTTAEEVKFYTQGTLRQTISYTGGVRNVTSPQLHVGCQQGTSKYWDGEIDELSIWSKTVTAASDLYNSGSGIPYDAGGGGGATRNPTVMFWT